MTYNEYDQLSRLRKVTDPHGKVTELKYDGNGNLLEVKDPGLTTTTYAYDLRDRLTTRTDPFGKLDTWVWDGNNNLASTTDRRGQQTTFTYDALDRRALATYADTATTATSYSFSGVEAEAVVTDSIAGAVTRRLDGLDRLKYEISPQGRIDYAYDAASRRTSMQVQGEAAITYGWDDANRPTTITRSGSTITLGYDQADRRKSVSLPNSVEQRYLYGTSPTPTGIEYRKAGALTDSLADTWDADGRPVARAGTGTHPRTALPNATTFTHDRNRLTALNGTAWAYDFQGNLTSDGTYTYLWDARNRLKEIKQGGTTVASFAYDALNRRSARTVSGTTTEYVHDGMTPIQEKVGTNVTKLLTGPGIDDYLARVEPTKTRYYLTDMLGSTVALTNESGDVATSYTYEPYGDTSISGEGSANGFQFTGRENDNTGLYFYRARYYHPAAKRFISEDPIGQAGGANLYLYVEADPVNGVDPDGLTGRRGNGNPRPGATNPSGQPGSWFRGQFYPRLGETEPHPAAGGRGYCPYPPVGSNPKRGGGRTNTEGGNLDPVQTFVGNSGAGSYTVEPMAGGGTRISAPGANGGTTQIRFNQDGSTRVDIFPPGLPGQGQSETVHWPAARQ